MDLPLSCCRVLASPALQVQGLDQHQLAVLFSGTMTHLVAHVERMLDDQQQQLQQEQQQQLALEPGTPCSNSSSSNGGSSSTSSSGMRRAAAASRAASPVAAQAATTAAALTTAAGAVDAAELRRQVAAGLAAHVSGRVPLASALIPHIVHILGEQVSKRRA